MLLLKGCNKRFRNDMLATRELITQIYISANHAGLVPAAPLCPSASATPTKLHIASTKLPTAPATSSASVTIPSATIIVHVSTTSASPTPGCWWGWWGVHTFPFPPSASAVHAASQHTWLLLLQVRSGTMTGIDFTVRTMSGLQPPGIG